LVIGALSGSGLVQARDYVAPVVPAAASMSAAQVDNHLHGHGFLTDQQLPDSLKLLPPPPARNSEIFRNDIAEYKAGRRVQHTDPARWDLAALDAVATTENLDKVFSAAAGVTINPANTPITFDLLTKVIHDAGKATDKAKKHYMRKRPFMVYGHPTCDPQADQKISHSGSYPSGHASVGWAVALVLIDLLPDERHKEILNRGYEYGQSRVICGAHWQSDVSAGRLVGRAVFARLHTDPAFLKELDEARRELSRKKLVH
jgi:acid phosphatase (class A)